VRPFDANGTFGPIVPGGGDELRQLAVRGVGVTVLSGGAGLAIQVVATVILARLLTPTDFGLVAMVTTFSLLLANFGFNGVTEAIVQREEIDHALASNLFWINVAGSLLLALAFAASGSLLARFYKDPRVAGVSEAMASTIFLTGLSVVPLALLKRAMRFSMVSTIDVLARAIAVAVSVILGWAGWSYWALVAGAVSQPVSTCLGAWTSCRFLPGFPRRRVGTRSTVGFAVSTYGRYCTGYFTNNLDNFLIGWRLGPASLGYYKKAYDLFALSSGQFSIGLTVVAVSALSRLRHDAIQYRRYFLGAVGVMAFVGMGVGADLTLVGKDLILVLLGPKWAETGRIFMLFGPGIGVMLLYGTHIWLHLSLGRADRWFQWGLIDLVVTSLFLCIGLRWRAEGIALAWVAAYWVITLPSLWYAGKPIQLGIAPVLAVVWRYLLASLIAGCAAELFVQAVRSLLAMSGSVWPLARVVMVSLVFGTLYVGAVTLLHGSRAPLTQLAGLLREMVWQRRLSPANESVGESSESSSKVIAAVP